MPTGRLCEIETSHVIMRTLGGYFAEQFDVLADCRFDISSHHLNLQPIWVVEINLCLNQHGQFVQEQAR